MSKKAHTLLRFSLIVGGLLTVGIMYYLTLLPSEISREKLGYSRSKSNLRQIAVKVGEFMKKRDSKVFKSTDEILKDHQVLKLISSGEVHYSKFYTPLFEEGQKFTGSHIIPLYSEKAGIWKYESKLFHVVFQDGHIDKFYANDLEGLKKQLTQNIEKSSTDIKP